MTFFMIWSKLCQKSLFLTVFWPLQPKIFKIFKKKCHFRIPDSISLLKIVYFGLCLKKSFRLNRAYLRFASGYERQFQHKESSTSTLARSNIHFWLDLDMRVSIWKYPIFIFRFFTLIELSHFSFRPFSFSHFHIRTLFLSFSFFHQIYLAQTIHIICYWSINYITREYFIFHN